MKAPGAPTIVRLIGPPTDSHSSFLRGAASAPPATRAAPFFDHVSVRDILSVLERVPGPLVGADIVEYNPSRDVNGMAAVVAAKLIKEIAVIAARGTG